MNMQWGFTTAELLDNSCFSELNSPDQEYYNISPMPPQHHFRNLPRQQPGPVFSYQTNNQRETALPMPYPIPSPGNMYYLAPMYPNHRNPYNINLPGPNAPTNHLVPHQAAPPQPYPNSLRLPTAALHAGQNVAGNMNHHALGQSSRSTPVLSRMSAVRLPSDNSPITTGRLASYLGIELDGNVTVTDSEFIKLLFPSESLPFPVDNDLLVQLARRGVWDETKGCLSSFPASLTEKNAAIWLNWLGTQMGDIYGLKRRRIWWEGNCNLALTGSPIPRKPDIVLLERNQAKEIIGPPYVRTHWFSVCSFAEVTTEGKFPKRMYETIDGKSYIIFLTQPDRRFVPALSFDRNALFSFTVTDREGQIRLSQMSLLSHGTHHALVFLRILAFLMFGSPSEIGYDTTMTRDHANHRITSISIKGVQYEIVHKIYALQSLVGRGTKVWVVRKDGHLYIVKDSWIQPDRVESEIQHLKRIQGEKEIAAHVPNLVEGEDVMVDGRVDCTSWYRSNGIGHSSSRRVHRRILMTPIGLPLTSFKNKRQLIGALIDIIRVHKHLYDKMGILHQDISLNNVLLARGVTGEIAGGLLIDYDYAITVDNKGKRTSISAGFRTGTPPFMAIEIMCGGGNTVQHEPKHDLESILYVILWICTFIAGPGIEPSDTNIRFMSIPLRQWFNMEEKLIDLARTKIGQLATPDISLLPKFEVYWNDFKPYVKNLIEAAFPCCPGRPNHLTHEKMINILLQAQDAVQEPVKLPPLSTNFNNRETANSIYQSAATHAYQAYGKRERPSGSPAPPTSKKGRVNPYSLTNWVESVGEHSASHSAALPLFPLSRQSSLPTPSTLSGRSAPLHLPPSE